MYQLLFDEDETSDTSVMPERFISRSIEAKLHNQDIYRAKLSKSALFFFLLNERVCCFFCFISEIQIWASTGQSPSTVEDHVTGPKAPERQSLFVCEDTYRHRSGPQEVKVRVFPEQVTLRMGWVKLLSPHDEMAGEVTPCTKTDTLF